MNTHSQWSKQEACFAHAAWLWLAVNHNTRATSGKWVWCSKRVARTSELGRCQSNLCHSWGYELLENSKDSLEAYFENVNIFFMNKTLFYFYFQEHSLLKWGVKQNKRKHSFGQFGIFQSSWCDLHSMIIHLHFVSVSEYNNFGMDHI